MRTGRCTLLAGGGHYKGRTPIASGKSAFVVVIITRGGNAEIVVTAKVNVIVGRIAVFVDILDVLEIIDRHQQPPRDLPLPPADPGEEPR